MIPFSPIIDYKTIILAGLGREGLSSYRYFSELYPTAHWVLCDDQPLSELDQNWQALVSQGARFVSLADLASIVAFDAAVGAAVDTTVDPSQILLIKTAGIPVEKPGIQACLWAGATLTSNTAAFFAACDRLPVYPCTIGVTGTKGKSTTTALLYHVLKSNDLPVVLAGNIGVPPLETLNDPVLTSDTEIPPIVVLELSSHQLRELTVSPQIGVIQDITPEHLDYYANFEQYLEAKSAICRFQGPQDWVVFNPQYAAPSTLAANSPAKKLVFALEKAILPQVSTGGTSTPSQVYLQDDWLWFDSTQVIAVSNVPLLGKHNLLNTMPAIAIAMAVFNVPAANVATAIRSFMGLPHRLEFAGEDDGVRYYNDSQATTPEAAIAALKSFPNKSVVLIAGGSDKGVSFLELGQEILQSKVTKLLLFPPMGENIAAALQAAAAGLPESVVPPMQTVLSMSEAVESAAAAATPDSVVLLSPACASFGLFKNYQDRGDQFKAAVAALANQ